MTQTELDFMENFEDKVEEIKLLDILKDELSSGSLATYKSIKKWLAKSLENYMSLKSKQKYE